MRLLETIARRDGRIRGAILEGMRIRDLWDIEHTAMVVGATFLGGAVGFLENGANMAALLHWGPECKLVLLNAAAAGLTGVVCLAKRSFLPGQQGATSGDSNS